MIEELQKKNDKLVKENSELKGDLSTAKETLHELRQEKYAL